MTLRPGEGEPDSAWVTVEMPFPVQTVREFLADSERLFRLHPHLEIVSWTVNSEDRFLLAGRNETTGAQLQTTLLRHDGEPHNGFTLTYEDGLKRDTVFRVAANDGVSTLTVTEHYLALDGPDDLRQCEVDTTLNAWILALRRHLMACRRWGKLPGWSWWNEKFVPRMAPRQRRIVRLLVWISALEFGVFLAAVLVLRAAAQAA